MTNAALDIAVLPLAALLPLGRATLALAWEHKLLTLLAAAAVVYLLRYYRAPVQRAVEILAAVLAVFGGAALRLFWRFAPLLLTGAVLILWWQALVGVAERQGVGTMLNAIEVDASARSFVLGRDEFGQLDWLPDSAAPKHIYLRNAADRGPPSWSIANVAPTKKLDLTYCVQIEGVPCARTVELRADQFPLSRGDRILFGPAHDPVSLSVEDILADPEGRARGLVLLLDRRTQSGAGAPRPLKVTIERSAGGWTVKPEAGDAFPNCRKPTVLRSLKSALKPPLPEFSIGGGLSCADAALANLELPATPFAAASIRWLPEVGFTVARGTDAAARVVRHRQMIWLAGIEHPFVRTFVGGTATLRDFTAGRTRYAVEIPGSGIATSGAAFTIRADRGMHRLPEPCDPNKAAIPLEDQRHRGWTAVCRPAPMLRDVWGLSDLGVRGTRELEVLRAALDPWPIAWDQAMGQVALVAGTALLLAGLWLFTQIPRIAAVIRGRWGGGEPRRPAWALRLLGDGPWAERALRAALFVLGASMVVNFVCFKLASGGVATSVLPTITARDLPYTPYPALLAWLLAGVCVAAARGSSAHDNTIFALWSGLVAFGHVTMMHLSLVTGATSRFRFVDDSTLIIIAGAGVVVMASQVSPEAWARALRSLAAPPERQSRRFPIGSGFVALLFGTAALLSVWFFYGTETGIAGILQPSEMVKSTFALIFAAMLAATLELDRDSVDARRRRAGPGTSDAPGRMSVYWPAGAIVAGILLAAWPSNVPEVVQGWRWWGVAALLASGVVGAILKMPGRMSVPALIIAVVLAVIFMVPIFRNDMSPFLIMSLTTVVSLLVALAMHWTGWLFERIQFSAGHAAPPGQRRPHVPPVPRGLWLHRWRRRARFFLTRPLELGAALALALVVSALVYCASWLDDARLQRQALFDRIGSGYDKPLNRFISWIEQNGADDRGRAGIDVQFVDIGFQVMRSRDAIAASDCGGALPPARPAGLRAVERVVPAAREIVQAVLDPAAGAQALLQDGLLQPCRTGDSAERRETLRRVPGIPEIQSDFASTWALVDLGRTGALALALLQCALVAALLAAALRIMKWSPAMRRHRTPAFTIAAAIVAFSVMLSLQWLISWSNALGVVPVMGQPSTFLSHGPSHFLLFGVSAVVTALVGLRLRNATRTRPPPPHVPHIPWTFTRPRP